MDFNLEFIDNKHKQNNSYKFETLMESEFNCVMYKRVLMKKKVT